MTKRLLAWGFWIVLGLFLLNALYGTLVTATTLNSYEETFQNLEHSQDTNLIDAFKFRFSYYPATYIDDSIKNRCAYLIGEIRTYDNDWDTLKEFYNDKTLAHAHTDDIYVGVLPIELDSVGNISLSLSMERGFSYSPFDVDVLQKMQSHYSFWRVPDELGESGKDIYAVYIAPACD